MRLKILISTLLLLLTIPASTFAAGNLNLSDDTREIWQNYLLESPRDQKTKEFLELRILTFIDNLDQLEKQVKENENPASSLKTSETFNRLKRDFKMLDSTIRNLRQFDKHVDNIDTHRNSDLQLLTSLGNIYGEAKSMAKQP